MAASIKDILSESAMLKLLGQKGFIEPQKMIVKKDELYEFAGSAQEKFMIGQWQGKYGNEYWYPPSDPNMPIPLDYVKNPETDMPTKPYFTHNKDNWMTPKALFNQLNEEFHFTIDGAADDSNHLCERWWGPGSTLNEDALKADWHGEIVWLNPPYSMAKEFIKKAYLSREVAQTVALVASRTDTKWWHQYVWSEAMNTWRGGVQGRFIKGRLKFLNPDGDDDQLPQSAPFPSAIIIFGKE